MGWGEEKGPSAEMVQKAEIIRAAEKLADAVREYRRKPMIPNLIYVYDALYAYDECKRQLLHG